MSSSSTPIEYRIIAHKPGAHLFAVSCSVNDPDPAGQRFWLPAWIPGSYMIREFARNIVTIRAELDGEAWPLSKLDKHSWQAAPLPAGRAGGCLTLHYEVYAWDLSVRAAHLDEQHGFFNGSSVFVAVDGRSEQPCVVDIQRPHGEAYLDWQVATALSPAHGLAGAALPQGFGRYRAADYDELIDHPVEMGCFDRYRFEAGGIEHDIVLSGRHDCDLPRLAADLARICNWQIELFGGPPPMDRYVFLTLVVGEGYGGLEHRASTALLCSREDLPWVGMDGVSAGYQRFLGLCSHEYFHSWNVKRIKPAAFTPYDLSRENYTRLLWAFEGFTSYYDELALVRSGVISAEDYLKQLGKTISGVLRGSGRHKQSVAESSFDAWTKYYRQDENAPNAIVSYYAKGALIALALDLQLRGASKGAQSLDDVMRLLWQRHGQTGIGVAEEGIFAAVREVGGDELGPRLAQWLESTVNGTEDLPLPQLLESFGIEYRSVAPDTAPVLGIKCAADPLVCRLATVYDDGPAQAAGLSAGDLLIACNGLRIRNEDELKRQLARRQPGEWLELHLFRRDELRRIEVELVAPGADEVQLQLDPAAAPALRQLRQSWLGMPA